MAAVDSENMVGPTPTSDPPISQSMESLDSSRSVTGDSPSRSPALDATDRLPRELDLQSQTPSRVEEYRQLFRLPPDEVLIQDFNCALQENFLIQGHMYLFVHHVCFYSNLFGFETKKIIPFDGITYVRRAKTVGVFPTAIEIIAGGKKYFFTSFLFRDDAFKLINEGWLQHSNETKDITDLQVTNSDISIQDNGNSIVEGSKAPRQSMDEPDIVESDKNGTILEESKHMADDEPEIVPVSADVEVGEEVAQAAVECSSSNKFSDWVSTEADAPGVPEGFTKVAEAKFPIQIKEFFNLFFSDDGVKFQESFHRKCGDKDFKCTSWVPNEKFGHTRNVSFLHPIKIYFGARFGNTHETQKYRVYRNSRLIVDTSQDISDVPYADYFSVEGRWDVEEECNDSKPGCMLRVYTNVAFSKKTMFKGKIVQSTIEECREAYATWIELAHEVLKQKNLGKGLDEKVKREKPTETLRNVEPNASNLRIPQPIPDTDTTQRVNHLPQGSVGDTSVGSLFGNSFANFSAVLKRRNAPTLLLIIAIAVVLLLMQISILTILSRPQRVLVIPQSDHTSDNGREAAASLNRQIKYLKEEMDFVETMLDRLQMEHTRLKGKLRELELCSALNINKKSVDRSTAICFRSWFKQKSC